MLGGERLAALKVRLLQIAAALRAGKAWLAYQWWWTGAHALGVWRYGPLGYWRHRQQLDRCFDRILRDSALRDQRQRER